MTLRDDIQPYILPDGLIAHTLGQGTGNGLRELALYILQAGPSKNTIEYFELLKALNRCEIIPGLYRRSPSNPDQEGIDDYIAVASINSLRAQRILQYGRNNPVKLFGPIKLYYFYNNVNPGSLYHPDGRINWSAWLGRFPAFIPHLQFAAGETPSWFSQILWAATVAGTALFKPKDQDPWILSWFLVQVAENKNWLTKLASKIYRKRLFYYWPGGIGEVLRVYFGHDHPLAAHFIT